MGTQSLAIILGCLALSDYFVVANAKWHRPPPPGPPGNGGKWVWKPALYKPESSSSSSEWSGDGFVEEEVVIIATEPTKPAPIEIVVTQPVYTTEAPPQPTTYPPTEPATIPPYVPEPEPYEPPAIEEPEVEEVEYEVVEEEAEYFEYEEEEEEEEEEEADTDSNFASMIVGAARPSDEATEPASNIPVGGIIGMAAAATVLAAMTAFFVKKRRAANAETEINPEEHDDLFLEEDMFVGESEDYEIPPPPPMEANEDGIELDESFFHLPEGVDQEQEADNASVASNGLESV